LDIDIDFADRNLALQDLKYISAMTPNGKHPSGVYFHDIPTNPITGNSVYDHKEAEKLGYFKIDFLNNSIYSEVKNHEHLDYLINKEVDWDLFLDKELVSKLPHIHDHFDIVEIIKPKSILDLSIVISLIRPGKRHLLKKTRQEIEKEIWTNTSDQYYFKKSHSIAFAVSIIVQLNLLIENSIDS